MLQFDDIHKAFGAVVIADGMSLDLARGQVLGILGPNGAGKTSLFNLIVGTIAPDKGRILVDGIDITRRPAAWRCRNGIARSYQVPRPFVGMTVFENCLVAASFGGRARIADPAARCRAVVELCGLAAKGETMAGMLTQLDRKRLELARALSSDPALLLLDEIAGGLTEPECDDLVQTIHRVKSTGITIVWIEHVFHALGQVADRVILVSGGRILADGTTAQVVADPVTQRLYLGAQSDAA
jgi:branched-chain amino acid transport system ATP-binding protein